MRSSLPVQAIHEAAHFVVNYRLGFLKATLVTLIPDYFGNDEGHVHLEHPSCYGEKAAPAYEAYIIVLLAGYAANVYADDDPLNEELYRSGASSDFTVARHYAGLFASNETGKENVLRRCRESAARLVEEHWEEIEELAQELLRYHWFRAEEAMIIVDMVAGKASSDSLAQYRRTYRGQFLRRPPGRD